MIRPELAAHLRRWREVIAALAVALAGLWLWTRGGLFYRPLGAGVIVIAAIWAVAARRQMRFARDITAPGVVEVVEGAIRYYAPAIADTPWAGGEVALRDLTRISVLPLSGQLHWQLRTRDGQAMLIPVAAAGADRLAIAFASLPGIDMGRVSAAIAPGRDGPAMQTVWTIERHPRLT